MSVTAMRMCMGCGGRAPQGELLRLGLAEDGKLALVTGRHHRGRSGYLHRRPECWERFTARKGPLRSLGTAIDKTLRVTFVQQLKRLEQFDIVR